FESPDFANVPREATHPKLRGQKNVPAPFVLIPPRLKRKQIASPINLSGVKNLNEDYLPQSFSRNDLIEFSIVLIGRAVHQWARVLVAVRLLAENGLGALNIGFHLAETFAHDSRGVPLRVFSRENPRVSTYGVAAVKLAAVADSRVRMIENNLENRGENRLGIEFLSPISTRVLLEGKSDTNLDFADLLKKITERLEFLAVLHGEPPEKIDYRPLLTATNGVRTIEKSLIRYRFKQHSNRQQRTIPRDVFIGNILYRGKKLNEFLPYLAAGEILNVGSNTSAGLGRYTVYL
ncbi:MAG TPA: CRISPR system precrRNA processing endoribonuclease RAMP protein Cas6, partial [Pyrinomonadaceae bacterium]|nr:CRISPR system precrRNA processing endoribonuclease RAMP protein Cas6 [Pyrinomonadaceae bacterium]